MANVDKEFGKRVEYQRLKIGKSITDVYTQAGITRRTLQNIRAGIIPSEETLWKLAEALDTTVKWLLNGKPVKLVEIKNVDPVSLSKTIKHLCNINGYNLTDLACMSGITYQVLYWMNKGAHKPTLETVTDIARVFDMTAEELVNYQFKPLTGKLDFGERLKALIYDAGYTEKEFADKASLDVAYLKCLKVGKYYPQESLRVKFAELLNVTVYQLITGDGLDDYLLQEVLACTKQYSPNIICHAREYRMSRGWTLDELVKKTGLTRSAIYNIETQNSYPSYLTLRKLAEAYEVPVSDLIERIEP